MKTNGNQRIREKWKKYRNKELREGDRNEREVEGKRERERVKTRLHVIGRPGAYSLAIGFSLWKPLPILYEIIDLTGYHEIHLERIVFLTAR